MSVPAHAGRVVEIDDPDDPRIAAFRQVRERDVGRHCGGFIAEGEVVLRILARSRLCRSPRDADLWPWIDPATRPKTSGRDAAEPRGIPRRTLARLIDRLEKL